jgi:multiple sugar transport system substrate-binding protein
MTLKKLVTSGVLGAAMLSQAYAGTLVINSNQSDPAPKQAWADMIAQFETETYQF